MTQKTRRNLALFDIFFVILIFLDYFLLGEIRPVQQIDSFYNTTVKTGGGRRPTYEDRKILLLESGETLRLGKLPEQDYQKGQQVQLIVSSLSGNVNEIIILNDHTRKEQVGILSIWYFKALLILTFIGCIITICNRSRIWEIILIASSIFIWIFTIIYFFWF